MEDQGLLAGFFALSFAFILVILIWAVIAYLLTAFALYTMAKNDGATDGVLAFIPFLNSKIWGDLAKDKLPDFLKEEAGWKVFGIYVACFIFNFVPILYLIATAVSIVLLSYLRYFRQIWNELYIIYDYSCHHIFSVLADSLVHYQK